MNGVDYYVKDYVCHLIQIHDGRDYCSNSITLSRSSGDLERFDMINEMTTRPRDMTFWEHQQKVHDIGVIVKALDGRVATILQWVRRRAQ